jgi:uncharacterized membrane protein YccC
VSEDSPARRGTAAFVEALNVSRNAKAGFGIGVVVAIAVFVFFVGIPGSRYSPVLYVALAFVLAVGIGLLLTLVFTLGSAYRLARQL